MAQSLMVAELSSSMLLNVWLLALWKFEKWLLV